MFKITTLFLKSTELNSCSYDVLIPKREQFESNLEQDYKFLSLMQSNRDTEYMPSSVDYVLLLNTSYM